MITWKSALLILPMVTLMTFYSCVKPDEDSREKFNASWSCQEISQVYGNTAYTVHINKSTTNEDQVLVENFYNLGFQYNVIGVIDGSEIGFNVQNVSLHTIDGSGTMNASGNSISLTYFVDDGQEVDTVSATYTKQ